MDRTDLKKWDMETGARVQERAQFYSLTLAFTLLALSVETAKFGGCKPQAALEIVGSLSLLVSGLMGLRRALNIPSLYKIEVHLNSLRENIEDAEKGRTHEESSGDSRTPNKQLEIAEYINQLNKKMREFLDRKKQVEKKLSRWMTFHKCGLAIGILSLIASRVLIPAASVLFG